MKKTITLLLCILMITSVLYGCSEAINWDNLILGDIIPEPNSTKGEVIIDTDENLYMSLVNFSDEDFNQYIALCEDKGFVIDSRKDNSSFKAYNEEGYYLDLYYLEDDKELTINLNCPIEMDTLKWPINELSKMLPAPKSTKGYMNWEYEDSFYLYVGDTSISDFKEYITACSNMGFNVDYSKGDDFYYSSNEDGYHIDLLYEGFNIMSISFSSPDDASIEDTTSAETTQETTKATETKNDKNNNKTDDGTRDNFREAMDNYEAFIDEYVEFMKNYENSDGTDLTLLADYADYLQEYADMVESFEKWEDEELNDAELAYYIEVQSRVSQKLLEVAQ